MLHALLIDDEISARTDLREKLAAHRDVAIVGEAATLRAARALLTSADYDLVFLDVQLIGGESFELVTDVRPSASIVFATAYERYAARAFESNAIDYLLKPIDPARLAEALRRAKVDHAASVAQAGIGVVGQTARPTQSLRAPAPPVVNLRPVIPESFADVALTNGERVFLRQCLEAWEDSLPATHVLRAQRAQTAHFPRAIRYERGAEPTRLLLAGAPVSAFRRWWRALRAHLAS